MNNFSKVEPKIILKINSCQNGKGIIMVILDMWASINLYHIQNSVAYYLKHEIHPSLS
jgi:hypothetical protein